MTAFDRVFAGFEFEIVTTRKVFRNIEKIVARYGIDPGILYRVSMDFSIVVEEGEIPAEISTKPLVYRESREVLYDFLRFLEIEKECRTNDSTGLHFNISHVLMRKKSKRRYSILQAVRFAVLLDIEKYFDRLYYGETRSRYVRKSKMVILRKIRNLLRDLNEKEKDFRITLDEIMESDVPEILDRHSIVNYRVSGDYIEIRLFGGKDYEKKRLTIRSQCDGIVELFDSIIMEKFDVYLKILKILRGLK